MGLGGGSSASSRVKVHASPRSVALMIGRDDLAGLAIVEDHLYEVLAVKCLFASRLVRDGSKKRHVLATEGAISARIIQTLFKVRFATDLVAGPEELSILA